MSENRTVPPPKPNRPLAKPAKLPVIRSENAVPFFPRQEPRIRPAIASETELRVAADHERLNALERRVDGQADVLERVDTTVTAISKSLSDEITTRKLAEATKSEEKSKEDHKTKRFMALIAAIPIILAPIGSILTNVLSKNDQAAPIQTTVIKSQYMVDVEECAKSPDPDAWQNCVRTAQLKALPPRKR